uniref:Uncharacterized protein n=1 Tax=Hyaloperonospora arabidopsidis (strain Emoy2) TaxID=559515 RepID=M4BWX8_HYAAE
MRLLIRNRSTSAKDACFPTALLSYRMNLVVLVDEILNANHQLGARHPAVLRRRITAPANKITRSLPLHVTVVQDTLHVKALTTVRIHQWLWWGREYQLRIPWSCRRRLVVSSNAYTICVIVPNKRGKSFSLWRRGVTHPPLSIGRPIGVRVLPIKERAEVSSLS